MIWETADVLALIFGGLGLLGGAVGFLRAVRASKQAAEADAAAQDARSDAAAALVRSADATERIAMAIEIISARPVSALRVDASGKASEAELRALVPASEVRWLLEERGELDSYRLRNVGSIPAREVTVVAIPREHSALVRIDANRPRLEPGAAVVVRTERRLGLRVKELEISWRDETSAEEHQANLLLP